jgi:hypothetical protein
MTRIKGAWRRTVAGGIYFQADRGKSFSIRVIRVIRGSYSGVRVQSNSPARRQRSQQKPPPRHRLKTLLLCLLRLFAATPSAEFRIMFIFIHGSALLAVPEPPGPRLSWAVTERQKTRNVPQKA